MMNAKPLALDQPILFFDGVCGLCNRSVDFVLRQDRRRRLLFSPLQGDLAQTHLPADLTQNLTSLVLLEQGRLLVRSDAALRVAWHMGAPWSWIWVLRWIPRGLRDLVYEGIARNRYRWFGRRETCRLPSPEERSRFV